MVSTITRASACRDSLEIAVRLVRLCWSFSYVLFLVYFIDTNIILKESPKTTYYKNRAKEKKVLELILLLAIFI